MTIYKQILLFFICLFSGLLLIAYVVQFQSTRDYLAEQQRVTVINTANSLGLALTPYLEASDTVGAESVINAAFDGGFYKNIHLNLLASKEQIDKSNAVRVEGVPAWFTNIDLFKDEQYTTVLTSGWLQLGELTVVGHPGDAYKQLWQSMSNLLLSYLITFIVVATLFIISLRYLLKPLSLIQQQATEIEKHHFNKVIPLPKTTELKQVVQAINTLTVKLEKQFKEQADSADVLREKIFKDAVSGLGNRAYFMGQVHAWIAEQGTGGIMLIAVDALDDIYKNEGFVARDDMVKQIASIIRSKLKQFDNTALARIAATEYAVLIPSLNREELLDFAQSINLSIADLIVNPLANDNAFSVIGVAIRHQNESLTDLLTIADNALRQARTERLGAVIIDQTVESDTIGRLEWKNIVTDALENDNVTFTAQPVTVIDGTKTIPHELFSAIRYKDKRYSAAQFLPAVEMFKLGYLFDCYVLDKAISMLTKYPDLNLSVNVTFNSLLNDKFFEHLMRFFESNIAYCSRIALEVSENAVIQNKAAILRLNELCSQYQVRWGIDQFGRNFQSLEYLKDLTPDYVKADQGFTLNMSNDENAQSVLSAVCRAAHNAGAVTIATRVENASEVELIKTLFVDAYQGIVVPSVTL